MGTQSDNNSKSSRKFSLVTVLLVLWLIGLTALAFMLMKGQQENPLEDRVAKLEKKASTVVGKITPAAGNAKEDKVSSSQLAAMNNRINLMEKKIGELKTAQAPAPSSVTPPPSSKPVAAPSAEPQCNCDDLVSRLAKLEALMLAKKTEVKKEAKPVARAKKKPKRTVRRAKRKTPKPKRVVRRYTPEPEPVFISRPVTPEEPAKTRDISYSEKDKIYDSVYDISMRFGPMYGETTKDLDSLRNLAPGAAIYPGSSTSSYYNSSY
jgi:uncharacterized coiled-coil protein SlyX